MLGWQEIWKKCFDLLDRITSRDLELTNNNDFNPILKNAISVKRAGWYIEAANIYLDEFDRSENLYVDRIRDFTKVLMCLNQYDTAWFLLNVISDHYNGLEDLDVLTYCIQMVINERNFTAIYERTKDVSRNLNYRFFCDKDLIYSNLLEFQRVVSKL